jgi:hypothetical protein
MSNVHLDLYDWIDYQIMNDCKTPFQSRVLNHRSFKND